MLFFKRALWHLSCSLSSLERFDPQNTGGKMKKQKLFGIGIMVLVSCLARSGQAQCDLQEQSRCITAELLGTDQCLIEFCTCHDATCDIGGLVGGIVARACQSQLKECRSDFSVGIKDYRDIFDKNTTLKLTCERQYGDNQCALERCHCLEDAASLKNKDVRAYNRAVGMCYDESRRCIVQNLPRD